MLGIPAGPRRRRCAPATGPAPKAPRHPPGSAFPGVRSACGVSLVGGCCDGPPGFFSRVSRCYLSSTVPGFPGGSQNSLAALGVVEKGFFSRVKGEAVGSNTSPGVGVLTL